MKQPAYYTGKKKKREKVYSTASSMCALYAPFSLNHGQKILNKKSLF